MTNEKSNVFENRIMKRLFSTHFDGMLLIDTDSGRLININEKMAGKLRKVFSFDDVPYDKQLEKEIERKNSPFSRKYIKESMCLSAVKEKLSVQNTYSIEINTKSDDNGYGIYKQICFEYLDETKEIIVMTCEDVSGIISSELDPLTGLCNSSGFHKRVTKWIAENPGKKYRIHRYDIDRFKDINGVYGYEMGNKLLRDLGNYMRRYDNEDSFSAHLNADHFVRFCTGSGMTVQDYYDVFKKCFDGYDLKIPISMHVGVYDLCEADCDSFTMSYKALLALQSIKGSFSKHIAHYEKGMMQLEQERQELLRDVKKAIENEEFEVWFQPQVDYEKKLLIGAEALVRWKHAAKGLLPPNQFIPLLEKSDYIMAVDKYVIDKTCSFMRRWMDRFPDKRIIVSVNLSRQDILSGDFCESIEKITKKYAVPRENLRLEITESLYIDNPEVLISAVKRYRDAGFIIEIDDFGSGYSSLNILKDMDIDILKLDMKFLSGDENNKKSRIIISSIINMASALGLPVIAEGVETKEQADMLLGFGCRYIQGYYFSKPVPAEEYEKMIEKY